MSEKSEGWCVLELGVIGALLATSVSRRSRAAWRGPRGQSRSIGGSYRPWSPVAATAKTMTASSHE